jgi:hypothetical protein
MRHWRSEPFQELLVRRIHQEGEVAFLVRQVRRIHREAVAFLVRQVHLLVHRIHLEVEVVAQSLFAVEVVAFLVHQVHLLVHRIHQEVEVVAQSLFAVEVVAQSPLEVVEEEVEEVVAGERQRLDPVEEVLLSFLLQINSWDEAKWSLSRSKKLRQEQTSRDSPNSRLNVG